jgi:hypothetical protein
VNGDRPARVVRMRGEVAQDVCLQQDPPACYQETNWDPLTPLVFLKEVFDESGSRIVLITIGVELVVEGVLKYFDLQEWRVVFLSI